MTGSQDHGGETGLLQHQEQGRLEALEAQGGDAQACSQASGPPSRQEDQQQQQQEEDGQDNAGRGRQWVLPVRSTRPRITAPTPPTTAPIGDIVADIVIRASTREPRWCELCHTHIKMVDGHRTCVCQLAPWGTIIKVDGRDKTACIVNLEGTYNSREIRYVCLPEPEHGDERPDTRQLNILCPLSLI